MESLGNAIEVRHLRKAFGTFKAVDGIEFELKPGEFLLVILDLFPALGCVV